jgi:hypothetical protein
MVKYKPLQVMIKRSTRAPPGEVRFPQVSRIPAFSQVFRDLSRGTRPTGSRRAGEQACRAWNVPADPPHNVGESLTEGP